MINILKVNNIRQMVDSGDLTIGEEEGEIYGDVEKAKEFTDYESDFYIWVIAWAYKNLERITETGHNKQGWFHNVTEEELAAIERELNKDQTVEEAIENAGFDMARQRFIPGVRYLFQTGKLQFKEKVLAGE